MYRSLMIVLVTGLVGCSSQTTSGPSTAEDQQSVAEADRAARGANAAEAAVGQSESIIIDVRSKAEWDGGHLEQAVHIPHTEIAERITEVTNDKNVPIIVYCAVGGRAGKAKVSLEELGYTNVENGGGLDDMKERFK